MGRFGRSACLLLVAAFPPPGGDASAQTLDAPRVQATPAFPDCEIRLEERLRLGALSAPEEEVFGSISAVASDARGSLYVLDGQSGVVRVFDATGRPIRTFGRRGPGPAEWSLPSRLAIAGPLVFVFDQRRNAIVAFDTSGAFRFSRSVPAKRSRTVSFLAADSTGVYHAALPGDARPDGPVARRYDVHLTRTVASGGRVPPLVEGPDAAYLATGPVAPDGRGGFWFSPMFAYLLQHVDARGRLSTVVTREHDFPFHPDTRIEGRREGPLARLGLNVPRAYILDLAVDRDGRVRVLVDDRTRGATTLDLWGAGGQWLLSSTFSGDERPRSLDRRGAVYGRSTERGFPELIVYRAVLRSRDGERRACP